VSDGLRVAAVLPVGGELALLEGALAALRAQDRPLDELIVVDDTRDGGLEAPGGVRVLPSGGRGPYAARNVGWRAAAADVVLFCDLRSRPRDAWARRTVELFADPSVALAGSEVRVRGGGSLGARAGERHQFFELRKYVEGGFFRPYLPTCNLAARREDLAAVDGFEEVRSGADADLCWRILDRPDRRLATVPEVLMDWVPRDRIRDYLEQNYRYGKSNYALRTAWRDRGAPQKPPLPRRLLARRALRTGVRTASAVSARRRERVVELMREWARLAFQLGYRVAADDERRRAGGSA
jgi:glycosyltransferase involved in cell wall biosynthesis